MPRLNAAQRNPFAKGFQKLDAFARAVGHADAAPVRAAANALARGIRKQLGNAEGNHWDRSAASRPGEPPRKRRGKLQKSIGTSVEGGVRRVGSGFFTSVFAELGTEKEAPRPFMRAGLDEARPKMTEVTVSELRGSSRKLLGGDHG